MEHEDEKERRGIQSIEVGGQILVALADHSAPMSLKQLAEAAQMTPAKAHPYLVSYSKLGLVAQDPVSGRYGLGPLALRMGLSSLRQLNPVRLGMAAALELEQRVRHTVALSVWGNAGPTVIHLEESSHPIHMNLRAGTVMSLMTATGMVFAAYMPAKTIERFVEESMHPHAFPHIIGGRSDWKSMQAALQEVREHGIARAIGQPIPGVSAFAAPVFDHNGHVALVITLVGPTGGFDPDWHCANAQALRESAQAISRQLGCSAP
ncbi:IclR family transcriptional regulator [Azonexus hydrophilus]|uniref:IclR family transcriptional regulator n=1 Tax=Azonexus hydrophilus TaxID=418702 RepID=A0A1R1ICL4_9RHOO|nr:IclR family transcriptional regulator [Azonexus hydrophilus]OMG56309.1 IclR family transcriptional regulator [Azonexus hydrophilus]